MAMNELERVSYCTPPRYTKTMHTSNIRWLFVLPVNSVNEQQAKLMKALIHFNLTS